MSSIQASKSLLVSRAGPLAVQWFWQSDSNPWPKEDPSKTNWEPYPADKSAIIEEASSRNQDIVDIGDHEIDLKKMLQIKKADPTKIRRVCREGPSNSQNRFMIQLPKPLFIEKTLLTNASVLGSVQNFLNSFMKNVPDAYRIFYRIMKLDPDCKKSEYEDVVQDVIKCIEKAGVARENSVTSKIPNMPERFIREANEIIAEIKTHLSRYPDMKFRDFFKVILTVYTMDTFLCSWVNQLLESENWEKIRILTPFLILFIYAFQVQGLMYKSQESQSFKSSFMSVFGSKKLILYRGAVLTQENLENYHPGNSRVFSWNTVISTLKSKEEALKQIPELLKKTNQDVKGVLFIIEPHFAADLNCEGVIDITNYSISLETQEFLLAPGSAFEIIGSKLNKTDGIYEVNLKLVKKFKDTNKLREDIIFKKIFNDKAIIKELAPDELMIALQLIEGNKTIEKLEIERCLLDPYLMELIEYARITTNIQKEGVVLKNNHIVSDCLSTLCRYFSSENLDDICRSNNVIFTSAAKNPRAQTVGWITNEISLGKETIQIFFFKDQIQRVFKMIRKEIGLTKLNIAMENTALSKAEIDVLMTSLQALFCLESLLLDFGSNTNLSDEALELFEIALAGFNSLQYLSLSFARCPNITHKGISHLKFGLLECRRLIHLSLNFTSCNVKPTKLLANLKESLILMMSLQHLSLNLAHCEEISEQDFHTLEDTLELLTLLKNLSLDFSNCSTISDAWLTKLDEKLPISIRHLSLSFNDCNQISDEALSNLKNVFKCLALLQTLSLSFSGCPLISDQGLNSVKDFLQRIIGLQDLSLNFSDCKQISSTGLNYVAEFLNVLGLLEKVSLEFKTCEKITDNGIVALIEAIKSHQSLKHLFLDFFSCKQITGTGINGLKKSITSMTSLQSLFIDLQRCKKVSEKDLNSFKSAVKSLPMLKDCEIKSGKVK